MCMHVYKERAREGDRARESERGRENENEKEREMKWKECVRFISTVPCSSSLIQKLDLFVSQDMFSINTCLCLFAHILHITMFV